MFKLDRKSVIAASVLSVAALFAVGCTEGDATPGSVKTADGKPTIDGGMLYPVVNGKTADYYVNENADKGGFTWGRVPTANEVKAWDKDVTPTQLPPPGSGSVEEGEELYEAQCVMCHGDFGSGGGGTAGGYPALAKGNGYKGQKTLTSQRTRANPDADGPTRAFGSYWPQASTMWWYIQSGMPHPNTKSLSDDETYALTAYILYLNEIEIDGELVGDDYVLDQAKFAKIHMPNEDGFVPEIRGANGLENTRAFYADAKNFGGQNLNQGAERCMTNCQEETAEVVRIAEGGGIKDFLPPISVARDLPKEEGGFDPKKAYEANCAMCHSGYLAPGDAAWAGYTAKGMDKVYANGINGTEGGMPAKGGSSLSDADFKSVVDYLVSGK